ncbi:hypothetical protein [uncultured Microbulbifer sp.]|uniref:hypothetical protein n=1 Tax=uncultured Microbulbifer sp. TaxID=348147 RepID=UPI0025E984D6|nr:hypothetical protein [uncultured Microbulbifer sp.]
MNKLLYWLTGRLPVRFINLDSGPYLERYYLGQLFGITFYLHRFVSSDSERHLHNHPWGWGGSLILCGSYEEERALDLCPAAGPAGCLTERVRRRWYNQVNGNTIHRIHDAAPGTWTLFFHGPRQMVRRPSRHVPGKFALAPKGWGFFEQRELISEYRTEFVEHQISYGEWWLTAPKGIDAGRVPL